ncbi:MAG: hypothetical protein MUF85_01950 [Patescibacteria group bacterium]|jgi:hypothetical protein|nr:hypothetical protein [Patescibacteria group bacterium]
MAQSKSIMSPVLFLIGITIGSAITALVTSKKASTIGQGIKNKAQKMKESATHRESSTSQNDVDNRLPSPNTNTTKSNNISPKK